MLLYRSYNNIFHICHNHSRSGKPGASAIKPFTPQPDAKPVSRQESQRPIEDEGPSNKRPRHRGGRRRGGQGGGTPKTEA